MTRNRSAAPNAFVLDSEEETILVNGAVYFQQTLPPLPNLTDRFRTSGSWPATVTCGDPITVPCNTVLKPAIFPGENTIAFWDG